MIMTRGLLLLSGLWTVPQLSIIIIYNKTWSILIHSFPLYWRHVKHSPIKSKQDRWPHVVISFFTYLIHKLWAYKFLLNAFTRTSFWKLPHNPLNIIYVKRVKLWLKLLLLISHNYVATILSFQVLLRYKLYFDWYKMLTYQFKNYIPYHDIWNTFFEHQRHAFISTREHDLFIS